MSSSVRLSCGLSLSVPEFMCESIVLCSTCRMSYNSSCSLSHLLISFSYCLANVNGDHVRYMLSPVRLTVCNVRAPYTHSNEIFGNVSTPLGTLNICDLSIKILRRSSQGNPSVEGIGGGVKLRRVPKYSDFGPFQGYISETVQDRR